MRKTILVKYLIIVFAMAFSAAIAQDNQVEVYEKIHIPLKKPIPYTYVGESDVMWAKIVWRMVDLREKMNLPLYYPIDPIDNRKNLVGVLLDGIDGKSESGSTLTAYDANDEKNEFKVKMTKEAIDLAMGKETKTIKVEDPSVPEGFVEKTVELDRQVDQVKKILLKEKWYFDKTRSVFEVRIIGICPIRVYNRLDDQGNPMDEVLMKQAFWIYYPEARPILTSHEVYNRFNDAQHVSYDDLFMQRRFAGYIFKESNEYENRAISTYATGMDALYESEKVKEYLFNLEHDLWEY